MVSEVKPIATSFQPVSRVEPAASKAKAASVAASAPTPAAVSDTPAASPRIQVDPTAGVILQFLDSKGQVQTQAPSFAAVAYLKAGLTREGYSKISETVTPDAKPVTA